jgi:16S rRNA (guanine(527)-N(7))-methyltransferase RsmG
MKPIDSQAGDSSPMETILSKVPRETQDRIQKYMDKVMTWNLRTNLTGAKTPQDFFLHHILDCYYAKQAIGAGKVWLDVGSGNGLPGIVWACLCPEEKYYLVEASQKKAAFLSAVKAALDLSNVEITPMRFESLSADLVEKLNREQPSCVSRGTADPRALINMAKATKLLWKCWYVFSSESSHGQFLTLAEKSDMKVKTLNYTKNLEGTPQKGIITQLVR